jgi:deoxyribodipyrimidine photo-lyase
MESHLIDYDVASNWGNWQSIAGVSSDGKKKHFDINKQTKLFDPHRSFIEHWKGERGARQLDSVDEVDWPL